MNTIIHQVSSERLFRSPRFDGLRQPDGMAGGKRLAPAISFFTKSFKGVSYPILAGVGFPSVPTGSCFFYERI